MAVGPALLRDTALTWGPFPPCLWLSFVKDGLEKVKGDWEPRSSTVELMKSVA